MERFWLLFAHFFGGSLSNIFQSKYLRGKIIPLEKSCFKISKIIGHFCRFFLVCLLSSMQFRRENKKWVQSVTTRKFRFWCVLIRNFFDKQYNYHVSFGFFIFQIFFYILLNHNGNEKPVKNQFIHTYTYMLKFNFQFFIVYSSCLCLKHYFSNCWVERYLIFI